MKDGFHAIPMWPRWRLYRFSKETADNNCQDPNTELLIKHVRIVNITMTYPSPRLHDALSRKTQHVSLASTRHAQACRDGGVKIGLQSFQGVC
jgi:hypothetical protein